MPICLNAAFMEPANTKPSRKLCNRAALTNRRWFAPGDDRSGCGCSCPSPGAPSRSATAAQDQKLPPLVRKAVDPVRRTIFRCSPATWLPSATASRLAREFSARSPERAHCNVVSRGYSSPRRIRSKIGQSRGRYGITWSHGPSTGASNQARFAFHVRTPRACPGDSHRACRTPATAAQGTVPQAHDRRQITIACLAVTASRIRIRRPRRLPPGGRGEEIV